MPVEVCAGRFSFNVGHRTSGGHLPAFHKAGLGQLKTCFTFKTSVSRAAHVNVKGIRQYGANKKIEGEKADLVRPA